MPKPTRLCDVDGCDRKHEARGFCKYHWRQTYGKIKRVDVACPTCSTVSSKRDDGDNTRRFCSLLCRDLWRLEQPDDPMWKFSGPVKTRCFLPPDHPVRVLIRENAARKSPIRSALEAQDWDALASALEAQCVKVDDCWLWPRKSNDGYGRINVARKSYGTHRLMMLATRGGALDSSMPVHHKCAEALCCNPAHLQVVTAHENTAEMLERKHYQARIAALETALATIAPNHPLITFPISPAA